VISFFDKVSAEKVLFWALEQAKVAMLANMHKNIFS